MNAPLPKYPYRVSRPFSLGEARDYCSRLAKSHYENFLVASAFVPRELKQHFYNVYAFCRISDDLGDESDGPDAALPLLDWWESELDLCFAGRPCHPVFIALADTNQRYGIPREPYSDLLTAFRQDQAKVRYETFDELLEYCRYSANPVGRLVLYLGGYRDEQRQRYSDATCTALQLVNFWQDVSRDYSIGRIYLPQEDLRRYNVAEAEIEAGYFSPGFADLLRFECDRTSALFDVGLKLLPLVDRRLRLDIEMFTRGGQEILRLVRGQNYDVLTRRPEVPKSRQLAILARRLVIGWFQR